jgi:hypothetical protein
MTYGIRGTPGRKLSRGRDNGSSFEENKN